MNEMNDVMAEKNARRYKLAIVAHANGLNVADPAVAQAIWDTDSAALMDEIIRRMDAAADPGKGAYAVGEYADLLGNT